MQTIVISNFGVYKPKKIMTNHDFSEFLDTSDDWIKSRTGIEQRHIANEEETTSFMAYKSAINTFNKCNIKKENIDCIIVATMTPDVPYPSTACYVQQKIGIPDIPCFDIKSACSGFIYAITVGYSMLYANNNYQNILVIGSERLSKVIDWKDRNTCVLFGDGAGCAILSKKNICKKSNFINFKILNHYIGANGLYTDILYQPAGGSNITTSISSIENRQHFLKMNGKEVFKKAVKVAIKSINKILNDSNIKIDKIKYIISHQANIRIMESIASYLNFPIQNFLSNLKEMGNTSAASIPIVISDFYDKNIFKKGDLIILVAFGAGLTWGSILLECI